MIHDEQIIHFLAEAGTAGLSKDKLARHIFNATNTFFQTTDFDTIKREVDSFVRRNSQDSYSLLEKLPTTPLRYRLNPNSSQFTQLSLNFTDEEPTVPESTSEEQSLTLDFDF